MSEVKRYDYGYVDDGNGARYLGLIEKTEGKLVRHDDYAALEAELAALKAPAVADKVFTSGFASRPAQTEQQPISRDTIRAVFLRNGFTVKEGQADLKPYVYAAAEELLRLNAAPIAQTPADGLVEALEATNQLLRTKRHACENPQVCHVLDIHIERNRAALAAHRAQGDNE